MCASWQEEEVDDHEEEEEEETNILQICTQETTQHENTRDILKPTQRSNVALIN